MLSTYSEARVGYTHHWYRPINLPRDRWTSFLADWIDVYDALVVRGLPLSGPDSANFPPVFHDRLVAFNGRPGWESFVLSRRFERPDRAKEDGSCFSLCKTERMPYDLAVTGCLVVAKRHFGDALAVGSDGEDVDWQPARDLCESVLNYGLDFHVAYDWKSNRHLLIDCRS